MMEHRENGESNIPKSHLDVVEAALAIRGGAIKGMPEEVLRGHLQLLGRHQVDWPSKLKQELVDRAIAQWFVSEARYKNINSLMSMIAHWHTLGEETSAPPPFVPEQPMLCCTDGTPMEKAKEFKQTLVKQVLVPLMSAGQDKSASCMLLCEGVLGCLTNLDFVDEIYGEAIFHMLRIFRAVASLIKGSFILGASSVDLAHIKDSVAGKNNRHVAAIVGATVEQIPFYREQEAFLQRFAVTTKQLKPEIDLATAKIRVAELTGMRPVSLGMGKLRALQDRVAPSALTDLKHAVDAKLKASTTPMRAGHRQPRPPLELASSVCDGRGVGGLDRERPGQDRLR